MGISLVGLVGFQLYWINTVIQANEERFHKDVLEAMNNVALKLEKQEAVAAFNKYKNVSALGAQRNPDVAKVRAKKHQMAQRIEDIQLKSGATDHRHGHPSNE